MSTLSQNGLETTTPNHLESRPSKIRLSNVSLAVTAKEHQALDQYILNLPVVEDFPESLSKLEAAHLLFEIVENSPHCVLAKEVTAILPAYSLVKSMEGLFEKLQDAWNTKSFAEIRSLEILQVKPATRPFNVVPDDYISVKDQNEATIASWKTEYRPGAEAPRHDRKILS
ncbi:hypothetical protein K439DRAFT_741801 [Ramaria rubella]|nr:hypothetical protein K439DRAFT_741801 [Ramaria rubella]